MSWEIVQIGTGQKLRLRPGTIQIGRAQTCLIRPAHQSVSRIHAEIVVQQHAGSIGEVTPLSIHIVDRSSTGHTWLNEKPTLGKGQPTPLTNGDKLSFGIDPAAYAVRWSPMVFSCSSRLAHQEVAVLEAQARAAGAFLTQDWTASCTHLIIEQLAITTKLLCCVADGGIPVSASFLNTLSTVELGDSPQAAQHRPAPPTGTDAAQVAELDSYLASPMPRRTLLKRIWVIFATKGMSDVLSKPVLHAGAPVQMLCASREQAAQVAEDLLRNSQGNQAPAEVWFIPSADDGLVGVLAGALRTLSANCLAVPLPAAVRCILSGNLAKAHADAKRLRVDIGRPGDAHQLHQQSAVSSNAPHRRRTIPWQSKVEPKETKEEETFPQTQRENLGMAAAVSAATAVPVGEPLKAVAEVPESSGSTKRRRVEEHQGAAAFVAADSKLSHVKEQNEKPPEYKVPAEALLTVSSEGGMKQDEQPQQDKVPISALLTVSSEGAMKENEQPVEDKVPASAHLIVSSQGGIKQDLDEWKIQSSCRFIPSQSLDTPAKLEAKPSNIDKARIIKQEQKEPSLAECKINGKTAIASLDVAEHMKISDHPPPRNIKPLPPDGWLSTTGCGRSCAKDEFVNIDGVNIPRVSWRLGSDPVVHKQSQGASGKEKQHKTHTNKIGVVRNFKLFRKADGQRAASRGPDSYVPLQPWGQQPKLNLAEAFESQPFDSQSQLPPL